MNNDNNKDLAILLLRIGVGVIFIFAGFGKLTDISSTQAFFGSLGIPLAGIMAWVVALVEFFGGILVLAGAYIRYPAILLAIIMLVAILTTKLGEGFSAYRLDGMLLLVSVSLALIGSGAYSVDDKLKNNS